MHSNKQQLVLVAKTRRQMANEYGVHVRTFTRWLIKHSIKIPSGNITPKHQRIIYNILGKP